MIFAPSRDSIGLRTNDPVSGSSDAFNKNGLCGNASHSTARIALLLRIRGGAETYNHFRVTADRMRPPMHGATTTFASPGLAVQVRSVTRRFDNGVIALDGLDLDVPTGQFLAILGPSGCGKSTLLRLIAGLDQPQAGSVHVAQNDSSRTSVAYVFQDAHLLPWRTVLQNVALPLELMHATRDRRTEEAFKAIEMVGLSDAMHCYPSQLSGGMRMRVSLARAMITHPALLLLDEPFAALDEITRQRLDEQLRELWRTSRTTVIFVTHSTAEAVFLAQRAVVLSRRPGRIVLDRAIELPDDRPASIRATPHFAAQTKAIYEALDSGSGPALRSDPA